MFHPLQVSDHPHCATSPQALPTLGKTHSSDLCLGALWASGLGAGARAWAQSPKGSSVPVLVPEDQRAMEKAMGKSSEKL